MAAPSKLHFYRALCSRIGITVIGGRSQKTLVVKTLTRCLASRAREAQHRRPHAPSARSSAAGGATDGYSNDDFQPLKISLLRRTDEEDGRHGNAPARVPKRREPSERLPDDVRQWRRLVAEFERRQENVRDLNERNMRAWVADTVTPLHRLPYIEQLAAKRGKNMDALSKVARILGDDSVLDLLEEVKPSPVLHNYRNKDEFKVGCGVDGDPKTVGFRCGRAASGASVVTLHERIRNLGRRHARVAKAYERYIRDSSLPACHLVTDGGFWRDIVVRSNQSGNLMAIIVVHPGNVERERLEAEKEKLSEFFRNGDGQECGIDSLYVQECAHSTCVGQQATYRLLYGGEQLRESIAGREFLVSPHSFFQVNVAAAATLYDVVRQCCHLTSDTTLIDVCCGTGTVAILLADEAKEVIGIELLQRSVEDARRNAQLNGVDNVEFLCGRADDVLQHLAADLAARDVVAVVNPSRAGLAPRAVRALRGCPSVRRVVYVSCHPEGGAARDIVNLCHPRPRDDRLTGAPFRMRRAVPVDMFPHTLHCELVLELER